MTKEIKEYIKLKVIEELENIVSAAMPLRYSDKHDILLNRIEELKKTLCKQ